jgi:O-antigen ligase
MPSASSPSRLVGSLDRLALFLSVLGIVLRWAIGAAAGTGLSLFADLVLWIPLALWFGARALSGGGSYRFSGLELALLGFVLASFLSVWRASYKLPAVEQALGYFSMSLLFLVAVAVLGPDHLRSLLVPTVASLSTYALLQWAYYFPHLPQEYDPARHGPLTTELNWRIHLGRVFATFTGPNQLGGFLALFLPILLGVLLDGRKEDRVATGVRAVVLGLGLFALALSRSLGAGLSLGAGSVAFAGLALTRRGGRKGFLLAGGVTLGAILLGALTTPLLPWVAKVSHSLHARRVYWQAAGSIARSAPLFGVGLDNYQEYFPEMKPETPQESSKAHNDYLQVQAETGVLGFVSWSAFLLLSLAFALRKPGPAPPPGSPPVVAMPGWVAPAGAGAGFLLAWLLGGKMDLGLSAAMAMVWIGCFVLEGRAPRSASAEWTRIGMAAGLLGIMVHMSVEFDLSDFGVAVGLFLVSGLVGLLGHRGTEIPLPPRACAAATGILVLTLFPLLALATPRALAADSALEEAEATLRAWAAGSRPEGPPGDDPLARAIRLAEEAAGENPLSERAWQLQAEARTWAWRLLRRQAGRDDQALLGLETEEQRILGALEHALRLRPRSARDHHELAELHRMFRAYDLERYQARPRGDSLAQAQAEDHLRQALSHQERAVELYPTLAPNRYLLARVLDESGRGAEALPHYQEALRLGDLAGRELENLDRMKIGPRARARCLWRLGRPEEALRILEELRDRGGPPGADREDENDDALRPLWDILEARKRPPGKGSP